MTGNQLAAKQRVQRDNASQEEHGGHRYSGLGEPLAYDNDTSRGRCLQLGHARASHPIPPQSESADAEKEQNGLQRTRLVSHRHFVLAGGNRHSAEPGSDLNHRRGPAIDGRCQIGIPRDLDKCVGGLVDFDAGLVNLSSLCLVDDAAAQRDLLGSRVRQCLPSMDRRPCLRPWVQRNNQPLRRQRALQPGDVGFVIGLRRPSIVSSQVHDSEVALGRSFVYRKAPVHRPPAKVTRHRPIHGRHDGANAEGDIVRAAVLIAQHHDVGCLRHRVIQEARLINVIAGEERVRRHRPDLELASPGRTQPSGNAARPLQENSAHIPERRFQIRPLFFICGKVLVAPNLVLVEVTRAIGSHVNDYDGNGDASGHRKRALAISQPSDQLHHSVRSEQDRAQLEHSL